MAGLAAEATVCAQLLQTVARGDNLPLEDQLRDWSEELRRLVQMQHAWNAAYEALATSRPYGTTALRRRLLPLSERLTWHAYWKSVPSVPAVRTELRQLAHTQAAARAG